MMPGVHTFYDGSMLLQPLAISLGIGIDRVNLVVCQFISLVLAYFHYNIFSVTNVSRSTRLASPAIFGLIFCYFCFGNAMKHLLLLVTLSYAIMQYFPPEIIHKSVFLFSMGHLIFIHWYRWYILAEPTVDITCPLMILVQKVTMLAFSLHDGKVKKIDELNEIQKREAVKSVPDILSFLSYMFHFQAILAGPACFYNDYMAWIDGTTAIGKDGKIEKPWRAVLTKLLQALTFILLYVFLGDYPPHNLITKFMNLNWIQWLFLLYIVMAFQRVPYYIAWTLADAIYNLSGFGFNGYDSFGRPQWDLVSNVKPWKVEMALNFKETLEGWNCCTMYWLRRVAYDRAPKGYRTLSTYLLSAVWHGLFFGYYVTFLTGALFTISARTVRRCLRWRFQGNEFLRRFYDMLTFVVTKIALSYTTFPFVMMHLGPGLYVYRQMYFSLHLGALFAIFALPRILPAKPGSKPIQTENIDEMKKHL